MLLCHYYLSFSFAYLFLFSIFSTYWVLWIEMLNHGNYFGKRKPRLLVQKKTKFRPRLMATYYNYLRIHSQLTQGNFAPLNPVSIINWQRTHALCSILQFYLHLRQITSRKADQNKDVFYLQKETTTWIQKNQPIKTWAGWELRAIELQILITCMFCLGMRTVYYANILFLTNRCKNFYCYKRIHVYQLRKVETPVIS